MNRLHALIRESPAIGIAMRALAVSTAGGATTATGACQASATPLPDDPESRP